MVENKELLDRKSVLQKKILTLEWDKKRHQINFSKTEKLKEYKKELEGIKDKLNDSKGKEV